MTDSRDIAQLLEDWEFEPGTIGVRLVSLANRDVIQMRVEMGVLQMETGDRPDGQRPSGMATYLDFLIAEKVAHGADWKLSGEHYAEVDREFMQFYQRRISWLQLKEYANVVRDANHTLALMDFCEKYSPDESWGVSHEQYRPFVLFHRTQADALQALQATTPENAIERINAGLNCIQEVFAQHEIVEHFEDDELVNQLRETRESLRAEYEIGMTLNEQLEQAIHDEQYELAAELRDQIGTSPSPPTSM
jgi:hypothetical protein